MSAWPGIIGPGCTGAIAMCAGNFMQCVVCKLFPINFYGKKAIFIMTYVEKSKASKQGAVGPVIRADDSHLRFYVDQI